MKLFQLTALSLAIATLVGCSGGASDSQYGTPSLQTNSGVGSVVVPSANAGNPVTPGNPNDGVGQDVAVNITDDNPADTVAPPVFVDGNIASTGQGTPEQPAAAVSSAPVAEEVAPAALNITIEAPTPPEPSAGPQPTYIPDDSAEAPAGGGPDVAAGPDQPTTISPAPIAPRPSDESPNGITFDMFEEGQEFGLSYVMVMVTNTSDFPIFDTSCLVNGYIDGMEEPAGETLVLFGQAQDWVSPDAIEVGRGNFASGVLMDRYELNGCSWLLEMPR